MIQPKTRKFLPIEALFRLKSTPIPLGACLFSQVQHAFEVNFHLEYHNKTKEIMAARRNARPMTDRRPSKALRNQLSSMSEGYSQLPCLLPQR